MATTTRKRSTAKSARTSDRDATESATPTTEQAASTETTEPSAKLVAAYWDAINERDQATGQIPAVQIDAVRTSYLGVPKRQRGDLVTKLNDDALDRIANSDDVDPGMIRAMKALSELFREVNENGGQTPAAPHDPVPAVAGLLAALDYARESILAELTDEQRERLAGIDPDSEPDAQETSAGTIDCLAKIGTRALNGRKRRQPQRSGKDLGEVIRDAVDRHPDRPVELGEISREFDIKPSGLWSRWDADNTPGVKPTKTDKGRLAFVAAA